MLQINLLWWYFFLHSRWTTGPYWLGLTFASFLGKNPKPPGKFFNMGYFSVSIFLQSGDFMSCAHNIWKGYPVSVGRVHITSGLDPYGNLDFETGYLDEWVGCYSWLFEAIYSFSNVLFISSPADLVILRWTYKHVREIARRMEFYRGEVQVEHPTFAEGSQASTQATAAPVEISAPKIDYSKEDDDAIDEFHRRTGLWFTAYYKIRIWTGANSCHLVETTWHSVCEQVIFPLHCYSPQQISRLELVLWSHASKVGLLMRGWMYTVYETWRSLVIFVLFLA